MGASQREKGARGERGLGKHMTELGFPATRAARSGVDGGEDIVCDALASMLIEVKNYADLKLGSAQWLKFWNKTCAEAVRRGKLPALWWNCTRGVWALACWDEGGRLAVFVRNADKKRMLGWYAKGGIPRWITGKEAADAACEDQAEHGGGASGQAPAGEGVQGGRSDGAGRQGDRADGPAGAGS